MAKTFPGKIAGPDAETAKIVRAGVVANDNATVNDINYPPGNATSCAGWKKVLVAPRGTGGAITTVTVTPLYRVGAGWAKGTGVALTDGASTTFDVMGRDTFFQCTALTLGGSATAFDLWAAGWEPFRYDGPHGG